MKKKAKPKKPAKGKNEAARLSLGRSKRKKAKKTKIKADKAIHDRLQRMV